MLLRILLITIIMQTVPNANNGFLVSRRYCMYLIKLPTALESIGALLSPPIINCIKGEIIPKLAAEKKVANKEQLM